MLTACVATGVQLRTDMDKGVFDRFKVLPIARIAPLAGPMVADLLRYFIASVLTFAVGIAIGYRPGGGVPGVAGAVLLAMLAGWSLAWIFTLLRHPRPQRAGRAGHLPARDVPADVPVQRVRPDRHDARAGSQTFAEVNPVSLVITALRDLANDGAVTAGVGWALLGCAVVIAVFAPLSVRAFNRRM